jgi:tetratricopeptide (TPR) repeat protein
LARIFVLSSTSSEEPQGQNALSTNYDWAFMRASRSLAHFLGQGKLPERLPEELDELFGLPEGEQLRRVSTDERFATPGLVRFWVEKIDEGRYQSPRKTLHFARLAHLAAEACTLESMEGGAKDLADLQALAGGAYANAQRICGDLPEAERALALACRRAEEGSGSQALQAFLISRRCALCNNQGLLGEALDLAEQEEKICHSLKGQKLLAAARIHKAIALIYAGQAEQAIQILQSTIPSIEADEDPYLLLAVYHNLARCYVDLERLSEALAVHHEMREMYQNCTAPLILLRGTWQEGRILKEIGHLHNAEAALLRALQGFQQEGIAYEAALICLDLADLYWESGKVDKLREILTEALPIFRSVRASQETLATLFRLQQAAQPESTQPAEESALPLLLFPDPPPRNGGPDDL